MSYRIERVNTLLRQELSVLIQRQLRDPRLDVFITVTAVDTSPDLKFARVYVSSIDGQGEAKKIVSVLRSAAGFLRTELARKVRLRRMPELSFQWDNSIEHGDHILRLLDEVSGDQNE